MEKNNKKVLSFPTPLAETPASLIVFQLGDVRVAIRWEIEVLPPPAALLPFEPAAKKPRRRS